MSAIETIALDEATRYRYLNYAMSVITSRALPDVRDGLKPVQRRILFAMFHNLHLRPEGRFRKSAAVVGEVMAKYHPHGDSSIYEAMVRLAQPFSLLHPLVNGQGNFGSMDGDSAAAMRYTESKLTEFAMELLTELKQKTVDYQATYDGQLFEPIVLPAQLPNLLINGSEGIAVGMATKIPPHNLREIIDACLRLIAQPDCSIADLLKKFKGPDFPTGGLILNNKEDIQNIYTSGSGPVKIRGTWHLEKDGRKNYVIVDEIPYATNKATLIEKIGTLIANKSIPQIEDIRDESTDTVRIVLVLKVKQGGNPKMTMDRAMAYLCKNTPLQQNFNINLTCLIPTEKNNVARPVRGDLKLILSEWLRFRLSCVKRRLRFELKNLTDRLHILDAFAKAFGILDKLIAIIRKSENRQDAHQKIQKKYTFSDAQISAILELRLYRLAKLEIYAIEEERKEKQKLADQLKALLASEPALWQEISKELKELRKLYGVKRKTQIGGEAEELVIEDESAYIVDEKAYIIMTRDGWFKRQGRIHDVGKIRTREGDSILAIAKTNTKQTVTFFSNQGTAFTIRVVDIPSTSGYGDPIQKYFSFSNGEKIIGCIPMDKTCLPEPSANIEDEQNKPPYGIAITHKGRIIRFSLGNYSQTSNKSGRKYMKPDGADDFISFVGVASGDDWATIVSHSTRALSFPVSEITLVRGAGKGVTSAKLDPKDRILAFKISSKPNDTLEVETTRGRIFNIGPKLYSAKRASKGKLLLKRDKLKDWLQPMVIFHELYNTSEEESASEETASQPSASDGFLLFRYMD